MYGDSDETIEAVDKMMKLADTDESGFIDYTEFIIAAMDKEKLLSRNNLEIAFKSFDTDKSGTISLEELRAAIGTNANEKVWKELLAEADENNDGEIDLTEFKNLMMKVF